ncbi:MAG: helix-turn-helix domain-containing protein [Bacteroidales bacterium]|nr:helix-turn-helix domain-containing protein [Bacteroidales bacterium]
MKKDALPKLFEGAISLHVSPKDPAAWKLMMLFEAANSKDSKIQEIANNYGYTREHFYVIKRAYEEQGSRGLEDHPQGPKTNYRRTKEVQKQIIRHRFLDPEADCDVIAQKMRQSGKNISQRSVERTINEYGLQKKGYIKQLRQNQQLK